MKLKLSSVVLVAIIGVINASYSCGLESEMGHYGKCVPMLLGLDPLESCADIGLGTHVPTSTCPPGQVCCAPRI